MIKLEELKRIADIKGLNIRLIEKDYLLELLLLILSKEAGRKLIFKGGTALYKIHSLNRFSEDLDFTLSSKIDISGLIRKVIKKLKDVGINGRIKELNDYRNQKNIKLEIKGPLFNGNIKTLSLININISLKEKAIYEPEQKMLFSQYPDIPSFDVFIMPLRDIFAEKIRAILTRDKARDIYDLWFLLMKGVEFDIGNINKKLKLYNQKFDLKEFIAKIEEKRRNWDIDLRGLIIGQLYSFDKVKWEIIEKMDV